MNVYRLPISAHPLLGQLAQLVADTNPPRPSFDPGADVRGDWRADIDAGPPAEDRPRALSYRRQLTGAGRPAWLPPDVGIAAVVYYPPGGAGLGWHTDSMAPGWRVYFGRPLGPEPGIFYAADPEGDFRAFKDDPSYATAFRVDAPGRSWHAVRAEGPRLSCGLRIVGSATARALGLPL